MGALYKRVERDSASASAANKSPPISKSDSSCGCCYCGFSNLPLFQWQYISARNFNQCGVYLQYKKQDGDTAMPKSVKERRKRCLEVCNRPSPTKDSLSTEDIVEDENNTNYDEETEVAVALSDISDANEDSEKRAAL